LASAGIAAVIFTGRSDTPVYVSIADGLVHFHDAGPLWGKLTGQTASLLADSHPQSQACYIGPAGERQVGLASIVSDTYQNLIRTGMGAVMGSKLLKAVVIQTTADQALVNPEHSAFVALCQEKYKQVANHPASVRLRDVGKAMLVRTKNQVGDLASRNHQRNTFDAASNMDADALKRYVTHNVFCPGCPIGCLRFSVIKDGPYACETEGPEYEPIWALGPRIGNPDLELLIHANRLCIDLGLDQIGSAGSIAFAMELQQRGLLWHHGPSLPYSLDWGDAPSILGLLRAIASREGLGDILADGSRRAAGILGGDTLRYAMQSKGVELSGQEPRQSKAFGLQLAVSAWGADWGYGIPTIDIAHNRKAAERYLPHLLPELLDVSDERYKPALVVFSENFNAVCDSLGLCKFSAPETYAIGPDDVAEGLALFLGSPVSTEALLRNGADIILLERQFNAREGFDRRDDQLPERFLREPLEIDVFTGDRLTGLVPTGEKRKVVIHLEKMLDEYYILRGWDSSGRPPARAEQ
jgi:aldehyde:ferredoxin oxidoreductase